MNITKDIAFKAAAKDYGDKINVIELPFYFVSVAANMVRMVFNLILVSTVLAVTGMIYANKKHKHEFKLGMSWIIALNIVLIGLSLVMSW